jgi:hypothetical protein
MDRDDFYSGLNEVNDLLGLSLVETVREDELKGWKPNDGEPGIHKFYLNAADCRNLAAAFLKIADNLKED